MELWAPTRRSTNAAMKCRVFDRANTPLLSNIFLTSIRTLQSSPRGLNGIFHLHPALLRNRCRPLKRTRVVPLSLPGLTWRCGSCKDADGDLSSQVYFPSRGLTNDHETHFLQD